MSGGPAGRDWTDGVFEKVADLRSIREGRSLLIRMDQNDIALFMRGGVVFAVDNVCAHKHFSALHDGEFEGYCITCPMHGWTYDVRTGIATTGEGRVRTFEVKVIGNDICIRSRE